MCRVNGTKIRRKEATSLTEFTPRNMSARIIVIFAGARRKLGTYEKLLIFV
jgi:hypothetical protein